MCGEFAFSEIHKNFSKIFGSRLLFRLLQRRQFFSQLFSQTMAGTTQMEIYLNQVHKDDEKTIRHLETLVKQPVPIDDEENIKKKEDGIMQLGNYLAKNKKADALRNMIECVRPFLISLGKAKAAKLVRNLVDLFLGIEVTEKERKEFQEIKVQLCQECIKWAREQNRVYLRQTLEARLVRLYNDIGRYHDAQALVHTLVKELKKMDDKDLIVEVQLEESKAYYHLSNLTKARAALTSARTTANAIYIPPKMQAALDMQSGILHAADERDFKTAFSYFYESFEGYDSVECPEAVRALKYMLLSKIMLNSPEDVTALLSAKLAMKYGGRSIESMKSVASAAKQRSLAEFNVAFGSFKEELQMDPVVKSHFQSLYDNMLEKNLCRIIEPYSRVQIPYVAKAINLPEPQVEKKLSQMILDKRINGILDQNDGTLIVFDDVAVDKTYELAMDTIHAMGKVVDSLYQKAKKLS